MRVEDGAVNRRGEIARPVIAADMLPQARGVGCPAEMRWVVAGAAVASVLTLLVWAGVLWHYLRPASFEGSLLLGPVLSFNFATFAARALMHGAVLAGAAAALTRLRAARALLLVGGLGVVTLGFFQFAHYTIFPPGLRVPRRGPDFLVNIAIDGARAVGAAVPHLLLVFVMAWRDTPALEVAADRVSARADDDPGGRSGGLAYYVGPEARRVPVAVAVVLAAAVGSLAQLADRAALLWVNFQPAAFQSIGTHFGVHGLATWALSVLLYSTVIFGAAGLLLWQRSWARRALLAGAVGLIALRTYGYVMFLAFPPEDMTRYRGPQLIVNTTAGIARTATLLIVYALVILTIRGRAARDGAPVVGA